MRMRKFAAAMSGVAGLLLLLAAGLTDERVGQVLFGLAGVANLVGAAVAFWAMSRETDAES
jgi:hypothetical protein